MVLLNLKENKVGLEITLAQFKIIRAYLEFPETINDALTLCFAIVVNNKLTKKLIKDEIITEFAGKMF